MPIKCSTNSTFNNLYSKFKEKKYHFNDTSCQPKYAGNNFEDKTPSSKTSPRRGIGPVVVITH